MTQANTRPLSDSPIAVAVRSSLGAYGKCGLVIDDEPAAMRRAARELYGAERLPRWWLQARSAECGAIALKTLITCLTGNSVAIVLCDRYIPAKCQPGLRAVPWDMGTKDASPPELDGLQEAVRELRAAERRSPRRIWSAFQTSYPYTHVYSGAQYATEGVSWATRTSEVLHRLRQLIEQDEESRELLRYGPTPGEPPPGLTDEEQYRRKSWRASIRHIAEALAGRARQRTVLLTGAGLSLAAHSFAPGMPATDELLKAAYDLYAPKKNRAQKSGSDPDELKTKNACACTFTKAVASVSRTETVGNFDDFTRLMKQGVPVERMSWDLMKLFESKNKPVRGFAECLRIVMLRYDQGLPYQHWLLTQLDWARVISTNFDTFHERAWANSVSREASVIKAMRDVRHIFTANGKQPAMMEFIVKPYGSLNAPNLLGLSTRQIEEYQKEMRKALRESINYADGVLVVLGHSVRDRFLDEFLTKLAKKSGWLLCWCVPEAYAEAAKHRTPDRPTTWAELMGSALDGHSLAPGSGPLPGSALEFAYDLVAECIVVRQDIKGAGGP